MKMFLTSLQVFLLTLPVFDKTLATENTAAFWSLVVEMLKIMS